MPAAEHLACVTAVAGLLEGLAPDRVVHGLVKRNWPLGNTMSCPFCELTTNTSRSPSLTPSSHTRK